MSEETSMLELLNERLEKEDIVKLACDYDNKFNKLEENNNQLKSQLQQKDKEIERLNNMIERLNKQLQQKDNIIKEVREYIESYMPNYDFDKTNLIKLLEILDKVD